MSNAENKTKGEIAAILQRQIYKSNIKHYIEPFAGNYTVADMIICEHRLVVAPNGTTAYYLQAKSPDVLIGCGNYADLRLPQTADALIYCDITDADINTDFWAWCFERLRENHKVYVLATAAPAGFAAIWHGRNKNQKLRLYGGLQWQK